jgi:hypothetical protein
MDNRSCTLQGCGRPLHVKKHGLCNPHYQRLRKYGDPHGGVRAQYTQLCTFDGCAAQRRYDQLCMGHYNQRRKTGILKPLRKVTDPMARDESGNKQCRRCDLWLPTTAFSANRARPDSLTAYCRRCERDKALIHNYGISVDQHEAMLTSQGGGCAICGGQTKDGRPFFVDHDHACCPGQRTCGKCIRGLLCGDCNLGIGYFDDDVARMEMAISYLRRSTASDSGAT